MVNQYMGLTTERKIFLGLVAIAGIALVMDQGFLGPSEATAESASLTLEAIEDMPTPIESQAVKPVAAILIDRLGSKVSSNSDGAFGSVFSFNKLITLSSTESAGNIDGQDSDSQSDESQEAFLISAPTATDLPALSSVMPAKNGGGAVLEGKLVRVGEKGPNGYRLILVDARAVLVERDGVQYAIEIPMNIRQD